MDRNKIVMLLGMAGFIVMADNWVIISESTIRFYSLKRTNAEAETCFASCCSLERRIPPLDRQPRPHADHHFPGR